MKKTVKAGHSIRVRPEGRRHAKGKKPRLGHLDIELTERCDNDCLHCSINLPAHDAGAEKRELKTDDWQRILQEASELGTLRVRFTGGEPLLRRDFAELYVFARRLGMKVVLFTNARNITPELARLFVEMPPLEKIEVSVYGMGKKSYEAVSRAPGSFGEYRRGVDLLLDNQIPFSVKGALLPANRAEIDEFESWAKSIPGSDAPPSYAMSFDLRGRRDSRSKNRLIQQLRAAPGDVVRVLNRNRDAYRKEMIQFCRKFMGPPGDRLFPCGAGLGGCVDAYGRFQPCLPLRAPELGYDLNKGSLMDALANVFPKLTGYAATAGDYLGRCARCFLKGLCGQCPARSWVEHGTLDTPVAYFCEIAHAQALDLGLLAEGENGWEVTDWRDRILRMK